ncbi:tetratricopeptide repeat domain-containing protein [Coemansia thaxteri]|nr:tetratricopeptide repeat domain-containing protein [Coemansia thaxteri]KAJ2485478.1 tetratricopeptide repeat domain-containing protein [Coemansia sp. RSA 2320]
MSGSALSLLAEIRQSSERRSFEVLKLAEPLLLNRSLSQASEDAWLVYEQIFLAAIDEGQMDLAKSVLFLLDKRFDGSQRVRRLHGLVNEACGQASEAEVIYTEMLSKDPTNVLASKRLIAQLKARGQLHLATQELVTYLDTHSNDFEAWLELSHLYLLQHLYQQAAFCLEEVILQQPANHYFHLLYAEIQYTMGHLDVALKELLRVVELSTDNVRAFYGVKLTADRILAELKQQTPSKPHQSSGKRDHASSSGLRIEQVPQQATLERLSELATERLVSAYNRAGETSKKIAEQWLKE